MCQKIVIAEEERYKKIIERDLKNNKTVLE